MSGVFIDTYKGRRMLMDVDFEEAQADAMMKVYVEIFDIYLAAKGKPRNPDISPSIKKLTGSGLTEEQAEAIIDVYSSFIRSRFDWRGRLKTG